MIEKLRAVADIASIAQSAAEHGDLDVTTYASVFEHIINELNLIIDENGGAAA